MSEKQYYSNKEKNKNEELGENKYKEDLIDDSPDLYEDMVEDLFDKFANKMDRMFIKGIYSFDIKELLNCLSKESTYTIAKNLGMIKISTLNKDSLIDKVLSEYKTLIEKQMIFFEEERYKILKSYVDNGGIKIFDEIDEDEIKKSAYFMRRGIIFPSLKDGKAVFLMPEVLQNLIKEKNTLEYRNIIKGNSEVLSLYRGMNKAYGVVKINDIKEIFKRYTINHLENYQVEELIREGQYYYNEYRQEEMFFINNQIENYKELVDTIDKDENLEYARITKEELISMLYEDWLYKTKFGKAFYKEFTNTFEITKDMVINIMKDLALDIQENELKETISGMLELMDESNKNIKDYMSNVISKFISNIRIWKYKGASINERRGNITTVKTEKSVGRNDLCICGSGKKFKKCCGKTNKAY
ncbi:SEC-C metal-binding domain-containing protein [Clostridium uliginosum]|uniref:Uncharacterized conserved protein YecA, UPF0149 family, contains C-terminal Zn-binding SEC-C motif n=1 Tax=Clostridium uliginosum TaxID=119641 RepID=A0A1I1JBP7_9CLOT|nr:SEC-C metal-binding domain-containing protein [Clostridium uliginosum]SFC42860.1 Uncharacterized conserved protein YecA, UPF0149 family, contains C-terminal Zn-binding SEC-C motif [Clostridium uliginosum]